MTAKRIPLQQLRRIHARLVDSETRLLEYYPTMLEDRATWDNPAIETLRNLATTILQLEFWINERRQTRRDPGDVA